MNSKVKLSMSARHKDRVLALAKRKVYDGRSKQFVRYQKEVTLSRRALLDTNANPFVPASEWADEVMGYRDWACAICHKPQAPRYSHRTAHFEGRAKVAALVKFSDWISLVFVPHCQARSCTVASERLCGKLGDDVEDNWEAFETEDAGIQLVDVPAEVRVYFPQKDGKGCNFSNSDSETLKGHEYYSGKGAIKIPASLIADGNLVPMLEAMGIAADGLLRKTVAAISTRHCVVCGGQASGYGIATTVGGRDAGVNDAVGDGLYRLDVLPVCSGDGTNCGQTLKKGLKRSDAKKSLRSSQVQLASACVGCLTVTLDPRLEFKRCSRCRSALFCSQDCFKRHWPTHKTTCSIVSGKK